MPTINLENPKTEYLPVKKLVPLEKNPRKISSSDLEILKNSISKNPDYFWARPLLVNNATGKLVVYAGNQRLRAAKELGLTEVPCIVETLSPEKEKERTIRDNIQNGDWDTSLLSVDFDLGDLKEWGIDPAILNKYSSNIPSEEVLKCEIRMRATGEFSSKGFPLMELCIGQEPPLIFGDASYDADYFISLIEKARKNLKAVKT